MCTNQNEKDPGAGREIIKRATLRTEWLRLCPHKTLLDRNRKKIRGDRNPHSHLAHIGMNNAPRARAYRRARNGLEGKSSSGGTRVNSRVRSDANNNRPLPLSLSLSPLPSLGIKCPERRSLYVCIRHAKVYIYIEASMYA